MSRVVDKFGLGKALTFDLAQVWNVQEVQPVLHVDVLIATHVISHDHLVLPLRDVFLQLNLGLLVAIVYFLDTWFRVADALESARSVVEEESVIDKSGLI